MHQLRTILIWLSIPFLCLRVHSQIDPLYIELSSTDSVFKLPISAEDWFEVRFNCVIKNNSAQTIWIVNPKAYKIFPHPWSISINGQEARFWSGDPRCAPSFNKSDIIEIHPGDIIKRSFTWHYFVGNFTRAPGNYTAKVRYNYSPGATFTRGQSPNKLSNVRSNWSNVTEFKIQ